MERLKKAEEKPPKAEEISKTDTAAYIYSLLDSVQKVAANKDLALLAHLIGLAKTEAKRCSTS
jgi:hypothetical protein